MDKKNRTGLQSKISHIFAGVPVPKKKKPLSDKSEENDINQSVTDDVVIEDTIDIQEDINPDLKEEINEVTFTEESLEDTEQDFEKKEELKKIVARPLGYVERPAEDKQAEEDLSQEQFAVISEDSPGIENKTKEWKKEEKSGTESPAIVYEDKKSSDSAKISQQEKPKLVEKVSLKEIIDDKSEITDNQKDITSSARETFGTPKPLVGGVSRLNSGTKMVTRIPPKKTLKSSGKKQKSKSEASQSRQRFMIVLIVVFSVLLVVVLLKNNGYFESGKKKTTKVSTPSVQSTVSVSTGNVVINWPQLPIYPDGIRDPMGIVEKRVAIANVIEHPDINISGTSNVEGGNYKVTVVNNPLPIEVNSVIKDNKGRDVKIIDVGLNQVVFEMGSVLWTYDLRTKKWIQNDSQDILRD